MRIVLQISFDGSAYCGWQIQNGQLSVQEQIQKSLEYLCTEKIEITGCGRTDSGVHAKNYIAHFDLNARVLNRITKSKINGLLPDDISIQNIWTTHDRFHSRFDAVRRKYVYRITLEKNPFLRHNHYFFSALQQVSLYPLQEICSIYKMQTHFDSFAKSHSGLEHFQCNIMECEWKVNSDGTIFEFHISANRFVRGMVRLMVGCALNYALNKISLEQIQTDILSQRQIEKSWSVPAHGLTLEEVEYGEDITQSWIPII